MKNTVLLGVTGSIAAYKACELVRLFIKSGRFEVNVLMTSAATEFVTPLTFQTLSQNPVALNMFERPQEWSPEHISLAEKAAIFIAAPCTANVIAKLSHGLADDMLTSTALACRCPRLIAPAMNTGMLENPTTEENIALLKSRGTYFVKPDNGVLACGTEGRGRMAEPQKIFEAAVSILSATSPAKNANHFSKNSFPSTEDP
ncbi:MAG: flavoprotein [Kiritimatiellia bacterium]